MCQPQSSRSTWKKANYIPVAGGPNSSGPHRAAGNVLEANKKSIVLATQLWNRLSRTPMSEFKFACPVCGQHITADSSTGGAQIQCPTCFQKIVVPQPPVAGNTK